MTKKDIELIVDRFAEVRGAANYQELSEGLGLHPQTAYGWTKRASAPVALIMDTCTAEEAIYVLFAVRLADLTKVTPPPRAAEPEVGYHETRVQELERELLAARTEVQVLRATQRELIEGLSKPAAPTSYSSQRQREEAR